MKNVLLYIWQLPQNLLGLLLLLFWKEQKSLVYKGVKVRVNDKFPSGISLGSVIILKRYPVGKIYWDAVKHEYGHTRQSLKWGWLYLVVIGLPSLLGNIYDRIFHKGSDWYYNQPWEKSADNYGGVER